MNTGPFVNPMFYMPLDDDSQISSILENNYNNNDNTFSIQSGGYSPQVKILYNGTGLHDICGTTPMLVLGHTFNRTEAGILLSITNKITLSGKIYHRVTGIQGAVTSGIAFVLGKENDLKKLFVDCPIATLKVTCNNVDIFSLSGVRTVNITTENSPDFLTKSMGYTVELEQTESVCNAWSGIVSASDTWDIEPVADDYIYETFKIPISNKEEYNNPKNPGAAPSESSPIPSGGTLTVNQIPQFKVSHKLYAKGVITETGCPPNSKNSCGSGISSGYLNAKAWVGSRLMAPWSTSNASGAYLGGPFGMSSMQASQLYLYNHVRATNFSITEGTYEIRDTWLAMPTGITHVEDYTIDISTDEKYVKTVKVNGTIKGLSVASSSLIADTGSLFPSGDGKLTLAKIMTTGERGGSLGYDLDDPSNKVGGGGGGSTSLLVVGSSGNRYQNALSGWHLGIKPYLYRRASSALNAHTYGQSYVPSDYSKTKPLKNPTYSKESLLNIIPWSTSETHDPRKGIITYSYEFNNKFTIISGVITENISLDDTGPNDVVAEVFVIGRRLGPIIQSLSTKTSSKRTVSIDITVMPATGITQFFMTHKECPLWTGGQAYSNIEQIIEGFKPFGIRNTDIFHAPVGRASAISGQVYQTDNSQNWSPTEGRYTRKVTWVYQQCNNSKQWMDT